MFALTWTNSVLHKPARLSAEAKRRKFGLIVLSWLRGFSFSFPACEINPSESNADNEDLLLYLFFR